MQVSREKRSSSPLKRSLIRNRFKREWKTSCCSLVWCYYADVVGIVRLVELNDLFPCHRGRGRCLKLHYGTFHKINFLFSPLYSLCVFISHPSPASLLYPALYLSQVNIPYNASVLLAADWFPLPPLHVCAQQSSGNGSKVTGLNFCFKKQQQWGSWCSQQQLVLKESDLERSGQYFWQFFPFFPTVKWQTLSLSSVSSKEDTKMQRWVHFNAC